MCNSKPSHRAMSAPGKRVGHAKMCPRPALLHAGHAVNMCISMRAAIAHTCVDVYRHASRHVHRYVYGHWYRRAGGREGLPSQCLYACSYKSLCTCLYACLYACLCTCLCTCRYAGRSRWARRSSMAPALSVHMSIPVSTHMFMRMSTHMSIRTSTRRSLKVGEKVEHNFDSADQHGEDC